MFRRLSVENVIAIGPRVEVDLAPLTLLVGPGASGKSTLLHSLALTAQSATDRPEMVDLVLTGHNLDLSTYPDHRRSVEALYHRHRTDGAMSVGFEIELSPADIERHHVPMEPPSGNASRPWPPREVGYAWSRRQDGSLSVWGHRLTADGAELLAIEPRNVERQPSPGGIQRVEVQAEVRLLGKPAARPLSSTMHTRVLSPSLDFLTGDVEVADVDDIGPLLRSLFAVLRTRLGTISLLGPTRGFALTRRDTGPFGLGVGNFAENTIRIQAAASQHDKAKLRAWLREFGLPDYDARWSGDGNALAASFQDPYTNVELDLAWAATGSQQANAIATALFLAPPGSLLLLEEPEQGLHPKFEKLLAEMLADGVKRGVQVVLSTHSEILVASVANAARLRRGGLTPEDVAIWEMNRNDAGAVVAARLNLSPRGNLEHWVDSFAKVEDELAQDWPEGFPEAAPPEEPSDSIGHPRPDARSTSEPND